MKKSRQTKSNAADPGSVTRKRASVVLSAASAVLLLLTALGIFLMYRYFGDPEAVRQAIGEHKVIGGICLVLITAVQVVIALIPGELCEIAAGYVFGAWWGAALCTLGIVLGSVAVLLLVRRLGARFVYVFYPKEKIDALPILNNPKKRNLLTLILFAIPGTPKDLFTWGIGLTDMSIPTYVLLTTAVRFPSVISSTMGGDAVGDRKYLTAVIIFAVTLCISGIGLLCYRLICRRRAQGDGKPSE